HTMLGELSRNVMFLQLLYTPPCCYLNPPLLSAVRCMSQVAPQPEPTVDNEAMKPTFLNRNPRNLEQMALALKDRGWRTTWPSQKFYHRCWCSQHHVTAEVFANSDPVPVLLCSTKECALKCELAASQAAGIIRMVYRHNPWQYCSDAVNTAMKEGGVTQVNHDKKSSGPDFRGQKFPLY
uniref:Uncharacterized protein n=1 Tax=Oncorhynchus kisutch TaxID=8019 RepID=A0A8C7D6K8_ONCKI